MNRPFSLKKIVALTFTAGIGLGSATAQSPVPAPPVPAPMAGQGAPAVTGGGAASTNLAKSLSGAFADVYEKVSPGVVVIEVERAAPRSVNSPMALQYFFHNQGVWEQMPDAYPQPDNQGSGFIITKDGYVLTNNHVLESGAPDGIKVTLQDGRKFPAKLVGVDPASDLAVLKIDAPDLQPVELGDSDQVRVGQFAFAIGAPFDLRYSFTFGIVGALGRTGITGSPDYEEYIQTDASINPGNSGGPLVDIEGRVVGVNTLINGINRGLGFAIPINLAKEITSQLITHGRFLRPWLGIGIMSLTDNPANGTQYGGLSSGVIVTSVLPMGPAARSNLRDGDVILGVDGASVATAQDLQREILKKGVGKDVELDVWRQGRSETVTVRTAERVDGLTRAAYSGDGSLQREHRAPQPTAGMEVRTLTPDLAIAMRLQAEQGVVVTGVEPGSPADVARVQEGDVITSIGSLPVRTVEDLVAGIEQLGGRGATLNINRGDKKTFAILKP